MSTDKSTPLQANEVTADSQCETQNDPSIAAQKEQAAQLSDKLPAIDPHVGGTPPPRSPCGEPLQERRGATSKAKRRSRRKKSNQFDFRADDDTTERIFSRVDLTGCTPSEAIRQLIEDGEKLAPRIILTPRTPPQQLEAFIGGLKAWRYEFQAVRSRLNAPMPQNPKDLELVELVRKWRATADSLHERIKQLLDAAEATQRLLGSLTPEKIPQLRRARFDLRRWTKDREQKAANAEKQEDRESHLRWADSYRVIAKLIEDLGIGEEGE
jgi:hypothetical protein